jgi:hypothetical protein
MLHLMLHRSHRIEPLVTTAPTFAHERRERDVWQRADLTPAPAVSFDEPIRGLQVREIDSATLFGHLFD